MSNTTIKLLFSICAIQLAFGCEIQVTIVTQSTTPFFAQITTPSGQNSPFFLFNAPGEAEQYHISDLCTGNTVVTLYGASADRQTPTNPVVSNSAFLGGNGAVQYNASNLRVRFNFLFQIMPNGELQLGTRVGLRQSLSIECFDCTNFPENIVCSSKASCDGVGCYFAQSNDEKFWKASCSNFISITDRQTSCYKQPNSDEYCVCFKDYCNTPVEIENAVDLRHTPFNSEPMLDWNEPTTPNPLTTTPERMTIMVITIPTTIFGVVKPGVNTNTTTATPSSFSVNRDAKIQSVSSKNSNNEAIEMTTEEPITSTDIHVHYANLTARITNSTSGNETITFTEEDNGADGNDQLAVDETEMSGISEIDHSTTIAVTNSLFFVTILFQILNV
ncbi:hypothetical protein M3Y98_00569000 [Aphelenchoides besseyi]|nr:hypothetical protein M3Y98_00569000 [Aphelenchoides besseyi]KAI6193770.1 hypothetical protein M3Y96_01054000 [Aphelenchoides besseyi]